MTNTSVKKVMYDEVDRKDAGLIFSRCVSSLVLKLVQYSAIKYFTLTTIAVVYNIAPFSTLFLAAIFLGEKIERQDIFAVILCFISVLIITYGMTQDKDKIKKASQTAQEYARFDHFSYLAFLCLLCAPILKST